MFVYRVLCFCLKTNVQPRSYSLKVTMDRKVLFVFGNFIRSEKFREIEVLSTVSKDLEVEVAIPIQPMKLAWPYEERCELEKLTAGLPTNLLESPDQLLHLQSVNRYKLIVLCSHGSLTPLIRKLNRLRAKVVVVETYGGFDLATGNAHAVVAKSDFSFRISQRKRKTWSSFPKSAIAIGPLYLRSEPTSVEGIHLESAVFLKSIAAYRRKARAWLGSKRGQREADLHEKIVVGLLERLLKRDRAFKIFQHPASSSDEIETDEAFFKNIGLLPEKHLTLESCSKYAFEVGIGLNTTSCFDVNWLGKPFIFLREAQELYRHKSWDFSPESQLKGPSRIGSYNGSVENKFVPAWHGVMSDLANLNADINSSTQASMQNQDRAQAYGQYFFGPAEPPYELLKALWHSVL